MTNLYNEAYASFMSKADFWVASANAVVEVTSRNGRHPFVLPFKWGRKDRDTCPESSARLPEPHGCSEVERTFIPRMGLTWTDAVALMGAHTLGKGHEEFSGHEGTWVRDTDQSVVFDRQYYTETTRRAWRPRSTPVGTNWIWGGDDRNVLMLNTDICLRFDIPDGDNQTCCTRINPYFNTSLRWGMVVGYANCRLLDRPKTSQLTRISNLKKIYSFIRFSLNRNPSDANFQHTTKFLHHLVMPLPLKAASEQ